MNWKGITKSRAGALGLPALTAILAGSVLAAPACASGATTVPAKASPPSPAASMTPFGGEFFSVAATDAGNAWAVGGTGPAAGLIAHCNGSRWTRVRIQPKPPNLDLFGVAATSPDNAWAVGRTYSDRTFIAHWTGHGWHAVASPSPGSMSDLRDVSATSRRNAWAVGGVFDAGAEHPLIEHWNGGSWRVVSAPAPAGGFLYGVAATSGRSAWAVGAIRTGPRRADQTPLILRWNGRSWHRVPSQQSARHGVLRAVTAGRAGTWAVGYTGDHRTLIERWTGTSWRTATSVTPAGGAVLYDVHATSARDVWAVGATGSPGAAGARSRTLIEHWNSRSWRRVPSPNPAGENVLYGVTATSAHNAVAVGFATWTRIDGSTRALILHWNGTAWR